MNEKQRANFYNRAGRALQCARIRHGLTQRELGERIGIQRNSVAKMETGNQSILLHVWIAFERELGRIL